MTSAVVPTVTPAAVWLGYACRRRMLVGDWLSKSTARIVCNITGCAFDDAPGRFERWRFNPSGFFDSPELAAGEWGESRDTEGEPWTTYAYGLYPWLFSTAGVGASTIEAIAGEPLPAVLDPQSLGYVFLGFDVLAISELARRLEDGCHMAVSWSCSPLFCNAMAVEIPTNVYTLLDEWPSAVAAAERFGREEPEPGPYVIVGVWADAPPRID